MCFCFDANSEVGRCDREQTKVYLLSNPRPVFFALDTGTSFGFNDEWFHARFLLTGEAWG